MSIFLKGTTPCKALRGLPSPGGPHPGRLNSWDSGSARSGGWLGSDTPLHQQEPVRQSFLLLTDAFGHREWAGPIPVSRVRVAWTQGAGACALKGEQTLGHCPPSWPGLPPWGGRRHPEVTRDPVVKAALGPVRCMWGWGVFAALGATVLSPQDNGASPGHSWN